MKKMFLLLLLGILLLGFSAGKLIDDKMKNLLQQIQFSEENAESSIFSNCAGPSFYLPNLKNIKGVNSAERVSAVEIVGNYVKEFVSSEDFKKRYNEYRESLKPSPPEKPKSVEELKNQSREDLKRSIEEMKVTKSQMPEDQQAMMEGTIVIFEEQLRQLDDPDNPMYSRDMDKIMQEAYMQHVELHKQEVAEWEKKYPANDPNGMIKLWLTNFIESTNDVDFNAETVIDEQGIILFDKPEYQRKDNLWKLCYRAGNETTGSALKFAQTWLAELNKGQLY